MNMYESLGNWKTSLCSPDCESCSLSVCFPCHIYAMANKPNYTLSFCCYALTILSIHRLWYELYYMKVYHCPSIKVDYCLGTDCKNQYMVVNGVTTPCIYHSEFDVCTYSTTTCIEKTPFIEVSIILSFFYLCIFLMNYIVRRNVREEKKIQGECLESTIPCGLAQLYREIV